MKKCISLLTLLFAMLYITTSSGVSAAYQNDSTSMTEFEKMTKYHEFKNNSFFILGANTHIFIKEKTVRNEKYKIYLGCKKEDTGACMIDPKTKEEIPDYNEGVRNGDVFNINSTTKLAQGTAFKLIEEKEAYIGNAITKTTFWEIEHVVSKQRYTIPKVGTWVQSVAENEAMQAGYRLHFTFYGYNVYATKATTGYTTAILTAQDKTLIFDKKNTTSVNKYTHFEYRGLYYVDNEWWVYLQKVKDGKIVYVKATDLKGGLPPSSEEIPVEPVPEEKPPVIQPDPNTGNNNNSNNNNGNNNNNNNNSNTNTDKKKVGRELIHGVKIVPTEEFATVYTTLGRTTLTNPTKLFTDRVYQYVSKTKVGGQEYIMLKAVAESNLTYYVYVDDIYSNTFEQVLSGELYIRTKLAHENSVGYTTSVNLLVYGIYRDNKFTNTFRAGKGSKFTVKEIMQVGTEGVMLKGDIETTAGRKQDNVYISYGSLTRKPTETTYDSNMIKPTNKVEIMESLKAYSEVTYSNGSIKTSGTTTTTRTGTYYTIVATVLVGNTQYAKIKPLGSSNEYYIELEGAKIRFHYS